MSAGGLLARYPAVFTNDSRHVFCCVSSLVKVYAVATGELLRTLKGHTGNVTCVAVNPSNPLQVFSGSEDGTVRRWDFSDGSLLASYTVDMEITHFAVSDKQAGVIYLACRKDGAVDKKASRVLRYDTRKKTSELLYTSHQCLSLAASPRAVVSVSANALHVYDLESKKEATLKSARPLTVVAIHPFEPYVVTGDGQGILTHWYCFTDAVLEGRETATQSTFHWHSQGVNAIAFTPDGNYLLSGGEEAVLVIWQLGTGHKDFLPRLKGAITGLAASADSGVYAVSCADNAIRLVRAVSHAVTQTIQGAMQLTKDGRSYTGLVVDPRSGVLVTNGHAHSLQFYDVDRDRHVMEVVVVPRNTVQRREKKNAAVLRVEHVCFSPKGMWMITLDRQGPAAGTLESSLKFWSYDASSQTYVLNTQVENPHTGPVAAMSHHPTRFLVVTASHDQKFKMWELRRREKESSMTERAIPAPSAAWGCRSVGFYRDYLARSCAFSGDGSLLGVAYGQVITLWDPLSNVLLKTLTHPPPHEFVRSMAFLTPTPYLVAITPHRLYVWDLLACTVWWSYTVVASHLAAAEGGKEFAVAAQHQGDGVIIVFEPASPRPLRIQRLPKAEITGLTYQRPRADGRSALVYSTGAAEFHFAAETYSPTLQEVVPKSVEEASAPSLLAQLFGVTEKKDARAIPALAPAPTRQAGLFATPSHALPPVPSLYFHFMDTMLKPAAAAPSFAMASHVFADDDSDAPERGEVVSAPVAMEAEDKREQEDSLIRRWEETMAADEGDTAAFALDVGLYQPMADFFRAAQTPSVDASGVENLRTTHKQRTEKKRGAKEEAMQLEEVAEEEAKKPRRARGRR